MFQIEKPPTYITSLRQVRAASDPEGYEDSARTLKILVTRNQSGFPGLREGGGEAVCVRQVVLSFEAGCELGQFHINVDDLDGKLGDLPQLGAERGF